ncbi:MAG: MerR family transcriptional regulator [Sporolactobacillus sp.]
MDYTVKQLGELAGVSARTLRYYDQIGLLKPEQINPSGYRIYRSRQVNDLQQILFYRELDFPLKEIKRILRSEQFTIQAALTEHHQQLIQQRNRLNRLIATVEKTIAYQKGERTMTDHEKFEGFKQEKITENERQYGKELREKYGEEMVNLSNQKFLKMSREDMEKIKTIEIALFRELERGLKSGATDGKSAQKAADLHKQWLSYYWPSYSSEAHVGLAQMYTEDSRFTEYYDSRAGKGAAQFLRDAILIYTGHSASE